MKEWLEHRIWILLAFIAVALFLVVAFKSLLADHAVKDYYLGGRMSSYCMFSQVNGDTDKTVFCSDDINKILDVLSRAKATLKK